MEKILEKSNAKLVEQNIELRKEIFKLRKEIFKLHKENEALNELNKEFSNTIARLVTLLRDAKSGDEKLAIPDRVDC